MRRGCGPWRWHSEAAGAAAGTPPAPTPLGWADAERCATGPRVTIFEGRSWRLVRWMDADGAAHGVPAGVEATAAFADGFVTGRGGCNGFRGSYVYDGSRLDVGPLAATLMACDEPAMRVEAGFHDG